MKNKRPERGLEEISHIFLSDGNRAEYISQPPENQCEIQETAHDVTSGLNEDIKGQVLVIPKGQVYLIPSSIKAGEIARVLREGYDVGLLNDGFHNLIEELDLDILMIDTHPGLNEETLLSIAIETSKSIGSLF